MSGPSIPPPIRRAIVVAEVIEELAASRAGALVDLESFPRDIEALVLYGLELPVVPMRGLTLRAADRYLCALGARASDESADRELYGLLHIGPPANVILIREGLPSPAKNYVLAHEIGHFVADVLLLQERWRLAFPDKASAVEAAFAWEAFDDGLALAGALRGLPPPPTPITARDRELTPRTIRLEDRADLVARELLAPWREALPFVGSGEREAEVAMLECRFGLPKATAGRYHDDLLAARPPARDFFDNLFGE